MIVYVESNFVLELALLQKEQQSCEDILSLCEVGNVRLILPAMCLTEPPFSLDGVCNPVQNVLTGGFIFYSTQHSPPHSNYSRQHNPQIPSH